jgi:hypothetical protein
MDDKDKNVNQPAQAQKEVVNASINDVSKLMPALPPKFYERSDDIMQLAVALSQAQGEFKNVDKDASNPFFKSKYAPLDTVVSMARPILAKNGLCVVQLTNSADEQKISIKTVLLHTSGQYIASVLVMKSKEATAQAAGSVITYGRRYSYMAILGLVASEEDDDGNDASGPKAPAKPANPAPAAPKEPKLITPAQLKALNAVMSEKNVTKEMVYKKYSVSSLKDLTSEQASTAIDAISKIEPKEAVDPDEVAKGIEEDKKKKAAEEARLKEIIPEGLVGMANGYIAYMNQHKVDLSDIDVSKPTEMNYGTFEALKERYQVALKERTSKS